MILGAHGRLRARQHDDYASIINRFYFYQVPTNKFQTTRALVDMRRTPSTSCRLANHQLHCCSVASIGMLWRT